MGMFMGADIVVKAVILLLLAASVATWSVWIVKAIDIKGALRRLTDQVSCLEDAQTLEEAARRIESLRGGERSLIFSALEERAITAQRTVLHAGSCDGIKERVISRLDRLEARAAQGKYKGLGLLATVGATAPFIGLFGTVWGIMNSFIGISATQTTTLAVVAPGIAEALLATALGLVAAIPAVVLYNLSTRQITVYRTTLRDASAAVLRLLSRDLECEPAPHLRAMG